MNGGQKEIFDLLIDNKVYNESYETFLDTYSDRKSQKGLFNYLQTNNLTNVKSQREFRKTYFTDEITDTDIFTDDYIKPTIDFSDQELNLSRFETSMDKKGSLNFLIGVDVDKTSDLTTDFFSKKSKEVVSELKIMFGDAYTYTVPEKEISYAGQANIDQAEYVTMTHKKTGKNVTIRVNLASGTQRLVEYGSDFAKGAEETRLESGAFRLIVGGPIKLADKLFGDKDVRAARLAADYQLQNEKLYNFLNATLDDETVNYFDNSIDNASDLLSKLNTEEGLYGVSTFISEAEKQEVVNTYSKETNPDLFLRENEKSEFETSQSVLGKDYKSKYKEELEIAKRQLVISGNENPTVEQIEDMARENLTRKGINRLYDNKFNQVAKQFKKQPEVLAKLRIAQRMPTEKTEQFINFRLKDEQLKSNIFDSNEYKIVDRFLNRLDKKIPFEIQSGEETLTLEDGRIIPKSEYDNYVKAIAVVNQNIATYDAWYDTDGLEALKLLDEYNLEEYKNDILQRNYKGFENFNMRVARGFDRIVTQSQYFIGKTALTLSNEAHRKIFDEKYLNYWDAQDVYYQTFEKDIEFKNAFKGNNFGTFVAQEFAHQLPIFATLTIPYIGIPALGLSSAGENWQRMVRDDQFFGTKTSQLKQFATSAAFGAAEVIYDRWITLPIMKRAWKNKSQVFINPLKNLEAVKHFWKTHWKKQLLYEPLLEVSSEVLTGFTQNAVTGRPFFENIDHMAFSGGMFGVLFGWTPFFKGLSMQRFSNSKQFKQFDANNKTITDLEFKIQRAKNIMKTRGQAFGAPKNKVDKSKVSPLEDMIGEFQNEINTLKDQNKSILLDMDKKMARIEEDFFKLYTKTMTESSNLRRQYREVVNSKEYSQKERDILLADINDRYQQKQNLISKLKNEDVFGTAFGAWMNNTNAKVVKEREQLTQDVTNKLLQENKGKLPKDADIQQALKKRWTENEIIKDFNNYKAKNPNSKAVLYKTKKQAISAIEKMVKTKQVSEQAASKLIANIEKGGHGGYLPTIKGDKIPVQVLENQVEDDRLETRTHEVGHDAVDQMTKGLSVSEKKAFIKNIGEQILKYLENVNPALYTKITLESTRDGKVNYEEVFTTLLEFASKKSSINSQTGRGLASLFSFILASDVNKKFGEKTLRIKNENEAVSFVYHLANKIKDGTLTELDIKQIREDVEKIAKKADKKETKEKVETKMSININQNTGNIVIDGKELTGTSKIREKIDVHVMTPNNAEKRERLLKEGFLPQKNKNGVLTGVYLNKKTGEKINFDPRKYKTKEEFYGSEDALPAVLTITNTNLLDKLIEQGMTDLGVKDLADFVKKVKSKLQKRILDNENFDPAKNESLFGYLLGKNPILYRVKGDVMKDYKKTIQTLSYDSTIDGGMVAQIPDTDTDLMDEGEDIFASQVKKYRETKKGVKTDKIKETKGVVFLDSDKVKSSIKSKIIKLVEGFILTKKINLKNIKYKDFKKLLIGKDAILNEGFKVFTEEIFGVSVGKVIKDADLNTKERESAQAVINEMIEEIKALMPDHHTAGGTATGVPRVLLNAKNPKTGKNDLIYKDGSVKATKIGKASAAETGSTQGLSLKTKQDKIDTIDLKGIFGINEDGTFQKGRINDGRIRGAIVQMAMIAFNQTVRQIAKQNKTAPESVINLIGDGKSEVAFSSSIINLTDSEYSAFLTGLPLVSKMLKSSMHVYQKRDLTRVLKHVYGDSEISQHLKNIGDDVNKIIKRYVKEKTQLSAINRKPKDFKKYLTAELTALNTEKALIDLLEIDRKNTKDSLTLDTDNINAQRQSVKDIGEFLIEKLGNKKAITYLIKYMPSMFANAAYIGDGSFAVDKKTGEVIKLDSKKYRERKNRYQVFQSMADYIKWGVNQVDGIHVYIPKGKNITAAKFYTDESMKTEIKGVDVTPLLPTDPDKINSRIKTKGEKAVKAQSLKEAKEARTLSNMIVEFYTRQESAYSNIDAFLGFTALNSSVSTPLRRAANVLYTFDGANKLTNKDLRYEHMIPASWMLVKMLEAHMKGGEGKMVFNEKTKTYDYINEDGTFDEDAFFKNYNVAIINKTMDNRVNEAGYKSKLTAGYNFLTDPSWKRYFNTRMLGVSGVHAIRKLDTKNYVGQKYQEISESVAFSTPIEAHQTLNDAVLFSRNINPPKGITILDFDDTLATTKSLVKYTTPDGTTGVLNAEQYAKSYQDLLGKGYKFDFSDFSKVVKAKVAPLFKKALKLQGKFGANNMFVLTARPADSAPAIRAFLKANGLNIPLNNITGLANSTSEAKALWVAGKVAEGYNDFYFADDALQNVQAVKNMLDQFDVKSKVQQAKVKFSEKLDIDFNNILQDKKGVDAAKRFSKTRAAKRGARKGKWDFLGLAASNEDLTGLIYYFIGKGKKGEQHFEFFKKALITPLNKAYRELNSAKQAISNDYKALKKKYPEIQKMMSKKTSDPDYIYSDAVRVYLWDKNGFEIPGLSKTDKKKLIDIVKKDQNLLEFADMIGAISKIKEGYVKPGENWITEDIRDDLANATNRINRKQFFTEFIKNAEIIFSDVNLNKIEALYGSDFRSALEDVLYATINGTNRTFGQNKMVNGFMDWVNGSIGATMFFNARSAVLQTISFVNFINWNDNNIFKAAAAFANQPQFWKDFSMIFNSDMLKQRRAGIGFDVNAAELAAYVRKSKQPVRAAINYLLNQGFLPTKLADSFAIAVGGASMYRNRVNTYLNQGMSKQEAEQKAFLDFAEIAEETQQSARPDKISQQQRSVLGRLILAFQNTPIQYMRLTKKAALDLKNGRGDAKTNISKIIYYTAVQNFIFYALQQALFAMLFGDDDDEEFMKTKGIRVANGMSDTILRGLGIGGAILSTLKNMALTLSKELNKEYNPDESSLVIEFLNLSPPVGIKARKISKFQKGLYWNKDEIYNTSLLDPSNPLYEASANLIEATTNIPLARLYNKTQNVSEALNAEHEAWQRVALFLGWSDWDVGIQKSYKAGPQPKRSRNMKTRQRLR